MTLRLRFHRRVRLLSGLWVNLGKTGVTSLSAGRHGLRYTVGRRRQRVTIGYPGTGLFLTQEEPIRRGSGAVGPAASFIAGVVIIVAVLLLLAAVG